MSKEEIKKQLCAYSCPKWEALPDFDVYMDQVIYFINDRLAPLYFNESDKIITSNMVNNYVKNSIVDPPIKKHYKQYHMAFLIAVCILKRCYSLDEITQLIKIVRETERSMHIPELYDSFSTCFDTYLHAIMSDQNASEMIQPENDTKEHHLMVNVIKTVVYKMYSELDILAYKEKKAKEKAAVQSASM
ncbi:DUF1836 domain-containing protein [Catenisphaera adipataccumulans]|jgi:glycosyltransferase involved in cell wall biosynthesis|uniref:Glycosyltransferase involved in cell wall biosynthesis n=1 Tax=Catenisphaera adipataccumulans TaxID=700500 RepID=A0A7W8D0E4_9FIRM|nr:DUF1836 domain-containing protein [Catenisphaera adipataccumulans]MBB5183707.1 glycosyltransferase involved in cell wall biosynthesis [Catenisphaera adipataccumulans]